MNAWVQNAALWLWQNSLAAAALAMLVLSIRQTFRGRIAPQWLCFAGWLVMVRLFLPAPLTHPWAWDRAWAEQSEHGAEKAQPQPVQVAAPTAGSAATVDELRAEIGAARSALEILHAGGAADRHPDVLNAGGALTFREQAPGGTGMSPDIILQERMNWIPIALWVWLAGAAVYFMYTLFSYLRFMRRLRRRAVPLTKISRDTVEDCTAVAGLRRVPLLLTVQGGGSPFLCGIFRPRIVVPGDTLAALTPGEMRHVLLHEVLHIARRDLMANWLLAVARALHWWNPLIHLAARRLLADREILRDQQAIALLREPAQRAAYGHTLLKLALPLTAPAPTPGLAPFFHSEKELKRRLTMIQSPVRLRRPAACAAAGILAILCAPLFTTVRGQEKSEPEKKPPPPTDAPTAESQGFRGIKLAADRMEKKGNTVSGFVGDEKVFQVVEVPAAPQADPVSSAVPDQESLRKSFELTRTQTIDDLIKISSKLPGAGKSDNASPMISVRVLNGNEPEASQALDNLRAVASKLREKGQAAEADAIEAELKKLSAPAATAEVKALANSSSAVSANELQQLRAEMAEVKAALAAIRNSAGPADLETQLEQLKLDYMMSSKSGFGPRHPKVMAVKEKIAAIEQLEADRAQKMLAHEALARKQSDKRIPELKRVAEAELRNAVASKDAALKSAEAAAAEKQQLHNYKAALDAEMKARRDKTDAESRGVEAKAPKAEAVKPTDQAGDDLPWGVAVPEKKGRVFSPYTPEPSVVDVEGFKKGDKVKCPHTGNFFRVP